MAEAKKNKGGVFDFRPIRKLNCPRGGHVFLFLGDFRAGISLGKINIITQGTQWQYDMVKVGHPTPTGDCFLEKCFDYYLRFG